MARGKGMVLVAGKTYRIAKIERGKYEVFRIADDARVGSFDSAPRLSVRPEGIEEKLLVEIALAALKAAKVSWSGQLK